MPTEVEIKRPTTVNEVIELVQVSINNGKRSVLAPERLDEGSWYILTFNKDRKVVGGIGSILYRSDSRNPDSEAEIDTFVVEEQFRGQGLENLLLERMLKDLSVLKISAVRSIVEGYEKELYFRYGFLPDPQDPDYMVRHFQA